MDEEEYVELEDGEASSFPRREMNGGGSSNIPNALTNRTLSRKNSVNKNSLPKLSGKKGLSQGLPKKDESTANKLKKKRNAKPFGLGNRDNNQADDTSNNVNNESTNDEGNDNGLSSPAEIVAKIRRTKIIVSISLLLGGILIVIFLLVAIVTYFANLLGISESFSGLGGTGGLDASAPYYKEAVAYHKALDKASEKYVDSCGVYLNLNYLHATLSYITTVSQSASSDEAELYKLMTANVDEVAKLMVTNCVTDYEIGGSFYNKLKNSDFLKNYYKEQLEYMDADSLVKRIFEYAEAGIYLAGLNTGFLSDNIKVTMGTCEQPYNKKLLNEGTNYSSTVSLTEYLMGVAYGEVGDYIEAGNEEYLKAFLIAATSWIIAEVEYESGMEEFWAHNGECWQVSCDINNGCTYARIGKYVTGFSGNVQKPEATETSYKRPLSAEKRQILSGILEDVWGTVMVSTIDGNYRHGSYLNSCNGRENCFDQTQALVDAQNGMNYQELLNKYYKDFRLINIAEDLYASDVEYKSGGYTTSIVHYDQTDYNDKFCGTKYSIKTSGCGVTAMASILSTFVNRNLTPPVVMQDAYSLGYCGSKISGTSPYFFRKAAAKYNLGYQEITKKGNLQEVLNALNSGNSLVIAHMGKGTFTRSGHYIILSKVNDKGQVYVLDPNGDYGTGWHDFNSVVVKELRGSFHIITKR